MTRLLITGASGQLGAYLLREAGTLGRTFAAWSGTRTGAVTGRAVVPVDLTAMARATAAFRAAAPAVVIHSAAIASVAACHREPAHARAVNVAGTALLARLAAERGARLVFVSTDLVFDGTRGHYTEGDEPAPVSEYGRSKAAAEQAVLAYPGNVVVRVSLLFGPSLTAAPAFFDQQLTSLRQRTPLTLFADEWRTPLSLRTAARGLLMLADSTFTGLIHFGGAERLSRLEMGQRLARHLGLDENVIQSSRRELAPAAEPRPRDVSLDSSRWQQLFPDVARLPFEAALAGMQVVRD